MLYFVYDGHTQPSSREMAAISSPVSPLSTEETSTPTRTASSNWPGPGFMVKFDVGVNLTPAVSKSFSFGYATRNIDESLMAPHLPSSSIPGNHNIALGTTPSSTVRSVRRGIRSRSALQLRTSPVSPLSASPISSMEHSYQDYYRDCRSSPGTPNTLHVAYSYHSPQAQGQNVTSTRPQLPYNALRQTAIDRRPLPPLPSFRLGQDLPWTSPTTTWTIPSDDGESTRSATDITVATLTPPQMTDKEDPQRTRELAELHEAMMAVDLDDNVWHPGGTWNRRPPRGPRELGWAVAVPTGDEGQAGTGRNYDSNGTSGRRDGDNYSEDEPPPAYTAGQWGSDWEWEERGSYWVRGRPRRRSIQHYYA